VYLAREFHPHWRGFRCRVLGPCALWDDRCRVIEFQLLGIRRIVVASAVFPWPKRIRSKMSDTKPYVHYGDLHVNLPLHPVYRGYYLCITLPQLESEFESV
jgi:hypothetical protein